MEDLSEGDEASLEPVPAQIDCIRDSPPRERGSDESWSNFKGKDEKKLQSLTDKVKTIMTEWAKSFMLMQDTKSVKGGISKERLVIELNGVISWNGRVVELAAWTNGVRTVVSQLALLGSDL